MKIELWPLSLLISLFSPNPEESAFCSDHHLSFSWLVLDTLNTTPILAAGDLGVACHRVRAWDRSFFLPGYLSLLQHQSASGPWLHPQQHRHT